LARKILLADDSVTAQNMGRKILVDAGYDVVTVNNGSAALKRVTESKPDLIVLDVYMPGYSGLEVCQRLKDSPETAHIPVLLTVGKLEPFKPDEARRARADAHIVKPFEASELLSAMARLEDRMVPTDGPRFNTTVSGVERFGGERNGAVSSDPDTGWKSRLRFPSRKKKEEEPEADDAGATFRDFRKGKGKAGNGSQAMSSTPPPGQEPGLVPDIPRDITPDELDALSALAAKLDGPIPAAENIASLAEKVGPVAAGGDGAPGKNDETVDARDEEERAADAGKTGSAMPAASEPVKEFALSAAAAAAAEMATPAAVSNDVQNPVERVEPAPADAANLEDASAGTLQENTAADAAAATVNAAAFVEAPAPIDQLDEPIFAVVPAAIPDDEKVQAKADEVVAIGETTLQQSSVEPAIEATEPAQFEAGKSEAGQAGIEQSALKGAKTEDTNEAAKAVEEKVEAAASIPAQEAAETEVPAPTDEELAEALRLLTPATGHAEIGMPSHGTLVAAGQLLAEEAARTAGANARWVAERVALTPEESSTSLEEEMFRAFAARPVAELELTNRVSAIAAAVENRLAEVEKATSPNGVPASGANAEVGAGTTGEPMVAATANELGSSEKQAEPSESAAAADEEEEEGSTPSGTFADATLQADSETASAVQAASTERLEGAANAGIVDEDGQSSSGVGGDADMGKHGKEGSGKSGWHQIRKPASTPAASDVVEAAKQTDADAKESSKAMAAAAAEGNSGPDASAIASIVDSVLADLRPKIVEEIAKKLGKK
jgi:CheY-like chemotaxis protein